MASGDKQQFNVYLPPELVRAAKKVSLEQGQSLSAFVADALRAHVQMPTGRPFAVDGQVSPLPIMFVRDMRTALVFCRALGLRLRARSRNGRWAELTGPDGGVGLHDADRDDEPRTELAFVSHGPLEPLVQRLTAAGFTCQDIIDEGFGYSVIVHGPDGMRFQVNEFDDATYDNASTRTDR